MADPSGTRYTGVAVKLSGIVNIARDRGEIDHYEILTYGSGVPMPIRGGKIDGVQNLAHVTKEEYKNLTVDADGLTRYVSSNNETLTGIALPIEKEKMVYLIKLRLVLNILMLQVSLVMGQEQLF